MKYVLLILLFISTAVSAQVVQETNDSRASRRVIVKNGLLLPKVCNPTTALPDLLNYSYNQGAIVFDSCNNKIKWWNGSFWDSTGASGGSGDYVDTIYRKAGQDSIFFTINGGAERAIKDSTGGGGGGVPIDSVAVRRIGVHYVGWNSGFGSTGTDGGTGTTANFHNTFIGSRVGNSITSGQYNVGIGPRALESSTTGNYNVGIGNSAMFAMQSGLRNTAIGDVALSANTDGANNVAIGYRALVANVNGDFNMAIGSNALAAYLGSNNVAVGDGALITATGAGNVGIGGGAGSGTTTGTANVFIGEASGVTVNTTGSSNVKIGYRTGRDGATTGGENTLVGTSAGNSGNTAGAQQTTYIGANSGLNSGESFSTFVGYYAGGNANAANHTGSYNNALGFQAMYQNSATVRTGSSNTIIGDRINLPSNTSSNQFVFGTNGVNYLTRFTGGGWLVNYTTSAVTTQTASTALEVNGTTGAVLFPRLTATERGALTGTAAHLTYDTDSSRYMVHNGSTWKGLAYTDETSGGSGITIDSVAVRRIGVHYVGWNSGFGGAGTDGGSAVAVQDGNHFYGYNAGFDVTSGYQNVAIGPLSMENVTTGFRNVALGAQALRNLEGGNNNFGLGFNAGAAITSGSSNVAIGANALDAVTTTLDNVAVGASALGAFAGGRSVAVGTGALLASNATSATSYNVGIGYNAGSSLTSGLTNTFIGGLTGAITTGGNNTMVGQGAGFAGPTTGGSNTYVGVLAGANGNTAAVQQTTYTGHNAGLNSGESFSSFYGYFAGGNANAANSTGSYNNAFGHQAMYYNSATVRTGSSNTVIGDRTDLPDPTSSNQFVFGINGVNYLTRFTGGGWLVNYTSSAVTTQTASTALEVNGTTGAILLPRLTTTQRDALTATDGMIIFCTDCTATDASTGVSQTYSSGAWRNHY